jgi:hypothetical protein
MEWGLKARYGATCCDEHGFIIRWFSKISNRPDFETVDANFLQPVTPRLFAEEEKNGKPRNTVQGFLRTALYTDCYFITRFMMKEKK